MMYEHSTGLITIDLEGILPSNTISFIDIDVFIGDGLMLKEGVFREALRSFDFDALSGHLVGFSNKRDHILPQWAPLLLTYKFHSQDIWTTWADTETKLYNHWMLEKLAQWDASVFENKRVSVKGCSNNRLGEHVYMAYVRRIAKFAKVTSYGEKCALVPISRESL